MQWRRALMAPAIRCITPRYMRLSGEIADQAILDSLRAAFPDAAIGHAYVTEAGVAFDVNDGVAVANTQRAVGDFHLHAVARAADIRGTASGYVGGQQELADSDGFVDTGDVVERRGDR
jgi:hypothetical protein